MPGSRNGYSLVELVVSLGLLSVAVMAAALLIEQSVRLFESTGRALRDPGVGMASAWLRSDIHNAASVWGQTPDWTPLPLTLHTSWGDTVTIGIDNGKLVRIFRDNEHHELTRRVLLQQIRQWRWRMAGPGLIDCELIFSVHPDPELASRVDDPVLLARTQTRSERFRYALRGRGASSW
jgi:prepilin-type N-terminal cleavage/methylation domain-containing protein